MMRPGDLNLAQDLERRLISFDQNNRPLPGIADPQMRGCLLEQLVDSVRRIRYVTTIANRNRPIDPRRTDPSSDLFDPLYAAVLHRRDGKLDEAFWLVFLTTQFAGSKIKGWPLCQAIYQNLDAAGPYWTWDRASDNPEAMANWIANNDVALKARGSFGNHKKYATLKVSGTGRTITTYVDLIGARHRHRDLIDEAARAANNEPRQMFKQLNTTLNRVHGFGRLGKFDYLTMVGKIGLAPIIPDSPYIPGATGPLLGAQLLFGNTTEGARVIDGWLQELEAALGQYFGMQVLEDALCNWQKSPRIYEYFNG